MQFINVNDLKPHPRNTEFFDDMAGEKWEEFLESVRTSGIIEPVVITQDSVIVSGHQRVRACKELGIKQVVCDMKKYESDDEILKDLIETNVRQRGSVGGSAKKVGMRIKELERLYGISHGGNQYKKVKSNKSLKYTTQEQLATYLNMSVDTLQNYKTLSTINSKLDFLLTNGIITKTTALYIIKKLTNEQQEKFLSLINPMKKITKTNAMILIDKITSEDNLKNINIENLNKELINLKVEIDNICTKYNYLEQKIMFFNNK